MIMVYEIESLSSARKFLSNNKEKVVISNPPGSTKYYGMRVIDYMFQILRQEFPDKIEGAIVNAYDDYSAFATARRLGYKNIEYMNG